MKHLPLVCILLFSFFGLKAQHNHFLYIQTENKQAFYIKLNKKLYSSSAAGYLILPKLKDSAYNLVVGFPKSEWSEQSLTCTVSDNDAGYLLKNFESKGWGLFNLQTLAVIMAADGLKPSAAPAEVVNKTDAFSTMLSTVVNDSSIRQTEVVKDKVKEVPKEKVSVAPVTGTSDPSGMPAKEVILSINKEEKASAAEAKKKPVTEADKGQETLSNNGRSVVSRQLLNNNAEGTEMVFTDEVNGKKDTIRVFIPADKTAVAVAVEKPAEKTAQPATVEKTVAIEKAAEEVKAPVAPEKTMAIDTVIEEKKPPVTKEEKPGDTKFLDIEVANIDKKQEVTKPVENTTAVDTMMVKKESVAGTEPKANMTPMINSDCKSIATDEDFMKLRKKMAAETDEDDMILLAKKIFKAKCFTVEQVKNLSVLFLKDAGKYSFFDMAYPRVSDSQNFSSLQNQLSETYYINRFQSMIRH